MKHIVKRFLIQMSREELQASKGELKNFDVNPETIEILKKANTSGLIYMGNGLNEVFGCYKKKINGRQLLLPIPDPTLVSFNMAQFHVHLIDQSKEKAIDKLNIDQQGKDLNENAIQDVFELYGFTCGFVIHLFTAIESFVNAKIPDDYKFVLQQKRKTEVYNRDQIMYLDVKTRIKEVLKDVTGKDFFQRQTQHTQRLDDLRKIRNEFIHTQPNGTDARYDHLLNRSFKLKCNDYLESVAKFMNFHHPDYIVECGCGKDF